MMEDCKNLAGRTKVAGKRDELMEECHDVHQPGPSNLQTIESSVSNLAVSEDAFLHGSDCGLDDCPPKRQKISKAFVKVKKPTQGAFLKKNTFSGGHPCILSSSKDRQETVSASCQQFCCANSDTKEWASMLTHNPRVVCHCQGAGFCGCDCCRTNFVVKKSIRTEPSKLFIGEDIIPRFDTSQAANEASSGLGRRDPSQQSGCRQNLEGEFGASKTASEAPLGDGIQCEEAVSKEKPKDGLQASEEVNEAPFGERISCQETGDIKCQEDTCLSQSPVNQQAKEDMHHFHIPCCQLISKEDSCSSQSSVSLQGKEEKCQSQHSRHRQTSNDLFQPKVVGSRQSCDGNAVSANSSGDDQPRNGGHLSHSLRQQASGFNDDGSQTICGQQSTCASSFAPDQQYKKDQCSPTSHRHQASAFETGDDAQSKTSVGDVCQSDSFSGRQQCRKDGHPSASRRHQASAFESSDEEKQFQKRLKERLVPDVDSSDSTSLSSESEDSGSDGSSVLSFPSCVSCHGIRHHDSSFSSDNDECTTPQPMSPTTIHQLPTVILIHIFSFLPVVKRLGTVNRVCKAWHSAVLDPSLWRFLDLSNLPRLRDSSLLQIASYSDRIHTLIMMEGKSTLLTDNGIVTLLERLPHLQRIDISQSFFLSNDSFSALGRFCHKLRQINFDGCFSLSDESLQEIGTGCPELEELNISQCSKVSDKGVCAIARGCPRLRHFRLDQCVKVTDEGVIALTECCPRLNYLHLLSCSLTDPSISYLSNLRNLQTLDISNISHLNPRCLERVALGCPKLESLGVSLNRAVDDQCIRTIAQACPALRNLSCVACSVKDAGLEYLGRYARNLERLDVAWCSDITEAGLAAVAAGCPKLTYLGFMRCTSVNSFAIEELVYQYPHIRFSDFLRESRRLLDRAYRTGNFKELGLSNQCIPQASV